MFSASKNAKIVGIFFIIFGIIDFLNGFKILTNYLSAGNSFTGEDLLSLIILFSWPILELVVGYGLFKRMLWAVYGMVVLIIDYLIRVSLASKGVEISFGSYVFLGIYILLFIWFFSGKKEFNK